MPLPQLRGQPGPIGEAHEHQLPAGLDAKGLERELRPRCILDGIELVVVRNARQFTVLAEHPAVIGAEQRAVAGEANLQR